MSRTILHIDMNNFYASVEALYHPELRGKPLAVCGDQEARHGIVLAKNEMAKAAGIRTGNPIWLAKQQCPGLVVIAPHYDRYLHFSRLARKLYSDYTNLVEPYGLDECWLDISGSLHLFGDGHTVADTIRKRIREELGVTASAGLSFNKVFAKLGSDLKKPDATTAISPTGWQEVIWPLPVETLLYVGPATAKILKRYSIKTIGDLAAADPRAATSWLGKWGIVLQSYALGQDQSPVAPLGTVPPVKSIGNSTTMPRDMEDGDSLRIVLYLLCESVAERLREQGLQCRTVQISMRWTDLTWVERQAPLESPSCNAEALFAVAYRLYQAHYQGRKLRSVGVRGCQLDHWSHTQLSLLREVQRSQKLDSLDKAVDSIRRRFGRDSVRRGLMLLDPDMAALNPQTDHPAMPPGMMG